MRSYLQQLVYRIKGSYWFIPIADGGRRDHPVASDDLGRRRNRQPLDEKLLVCVDEPTRRTKPMKQPDGALAFLAKVTGSMVTVAGVTFSLIIFAVSRATAHFGPRLQKLYARPQ